MINIEINDPRFLPHAGCELKFSLKEGLGFLLIGENGVGKTTLSKYIRQQYPDAVYLEQKPLEHFYDRSLTKTKQILLNARKDQLIKERLERLWNAFGLNEKEDRLLSTLSGGENQALKLAIALSCESDFYLLDEPSQFLDDKKKDVLSLICRNLLEHKKNVLVIEHDLSWIPPGWDLLKLTLQTGWIKRGT